MRQKIEDLNGHCWCRIKIGDFWKPWKRISRVAFHEMHAECVGKIQNGLVYWTKIT